MEWTVEKPTEPGMYLLRLIGVPQLVTGMNFRRVPSGLLRKVNGCTVTPLTEGYNPMPDNCLTYTDFLQTGNWDDFEFYGPIDT